MGSEPYVGWNWANICADKYKLHVITRRHHEGSICLHPLAEKVQFHYFELPGFLRFDHRSKWMKLYYLAWQMLVLFKVTALHVRFHFDIIHHITYNNLDVPGFLWLLPGVKFVWGPVGGGQVPEPQFKCVYGGQWRREVLRGWLKRVAKYNPVVLFALRKSSLVLFANEDTKRRFDGRKINRSYSMLETAIGDVKYSPHYCLPGESLHILWVGQVEPRKALRMAIDAIAIGKDKDGDEFKVHLDVVGDGPEQDAMGRYVKVKGIDSMVSLHGKVAFHQVNDFFANANIFLFTSVQDTSGNVVLEAMAQGVPVIALNHQGVKEIVGKGGGILINIGTYEETVVEIAESIMFFTSDHYDSEALGRDAVAVIKQHFTWEAKGKEVKSLYDEILG